MVSKDILIFSNDCKMPDSGIKCNVKFIDRNHVHMLGYDFKVLNGG